MSPESGAWQFIASGAMTGDHPLTSADLQLEVDYLRASGFRLRVFSGAGG